MERWKKILAVLGFALVSVGIAYALYVVFFAPAAVPPGAPGEAVPPTGGLPGAPGAPGLPSAGVATPEEEAAALAAAASQVASGGLTLARTLVPTSAANIALAGDGKSLFYYDRAAGQFFKVDPTTNVSTPLSDKLYPGVENASWTPTGDAKAILEFPDSRKIYVDFEKQTQVTLPSHWEDFDWAPNGSEVVSKSIGTSEGNRFLILANPDGSNARPIAKLGRNADKVDVDYSPNNDMVAFSHTGNAQSFGREEIIPIGKNQENFRSFTVEGMGFRSQWSPNGGRILYSVANAGSDWKPGLWTISGHGDGIGSDRKSIGLLTWADKCGFSTETVAYCAAPRDLPSGAGFAPAIANETQDDIYRVDLVTGEYRLVASPSTPAAISKIIVSGDGSRLYYTELVSGVLKDIQLR